jgi:hypothetical protein
VTRNRHAFEMWSSIPIRCGLSSTFVGQDAATLAGLANIDRPYRIRLLVVPAESVAHAGYLAFEKLAPVVSLVYGRRRG